MNKSKVSAAALKLARQEMARRGGLAGTGKAKARTRQQASRAASARWAKWHGLLQAARVVAAEMPETTANKEWLDSLRNALSLFND